MYVRLGQSTYFSKRMQKNLVLELIVVLAGHIVAIVERAFRRLALMVQLRVRVDLDVDVNVVHTDHTADHCQRNL